jgi:hypothetical protein
MRSRTKLVIFYGTFYPAFCKKSDGGILRFPLNSSPFHLGGGGAGFCRFPVLDSTEAERRQAGHASHLIAPTNLTRCYEELTYSGPKLPGSLEEPSRRE